MADEEQKKRQRDDDEALALRLHKEINPGASDRDVRKEYRSRPANTTQPAQPEASEQEALRQEEPTPPEALHQEEPTPPEALHQEEPTPPEALQQQQSAQKGEVPEKEARKLWTWYRSLDMQLVTHLGKEETDHCWKELKELKSCKELCKNPELYNLLASLHEQYRDGFTDKAPR